MMTNSDMGQINTKEIFHWDGKIFRTFDDIFRHCVKLMKNKRTEKKAVKLFNDYTKYLVEVNNISEERALNCASRNFGYYAGYFDRETEDYVNRVLGVYHPFFGGRNSHDVDPEEALLAGMKHFTNMHNENENTSSV